MASTHQGEPEFATSTVQYPHAVIVGKLKAQYINKFVTRNAVVSSRHEQIEKLSV